MGQDATATTGVQLELFVGLAVPDAPVARRKWGRKVRRPEPALPVQLDLKEQEPVDPDEIPEPGDYPAHWIVKAEDRPLPKGLGARSIFDLGLAAMPAQVISEMMTARTDEKPIAPMPDPIHRRVIREAGVTRHISMRYQETEEWAEKERARRARQKLPKPPKQTFRLRKEVA